jgi:hypothetical protein
MVSHLCEDAVESVAGNPDDPSDLSPVCIGSPTRPVVPQASQLK